jgi:hypothetical protein
MLMLLAALSWAGPDRAFVRTDEPLRHRYYYKVEGGDALSPTRPKWRRKRGPVHAWTFPDGVAEHYQTFEGTTLMTMVGLDVRGRPSTTVFYEADVPTRVVVHGRAELDVSGWKEVSLDVARVSAPGAPETTAADTLAWTGNDWTFTVVARDKAEGDDVFSTTYRDELEAGCRCVIVDRGTAWADGRVGARYRVQLPDLDGLQLGEVWAFDLGERVIIAAFVAREGSDPGLARGRAMVALLRFEDAQ